MPMRGSGPADAPLVVEHDAGLTWLAHPDEGMQRASHALATDDGVWLVDPVRAAGVDDAIDDLGDVAGVVLLLDRHRRDAAAVAEHHGVPVSVPATLGDAAADLDVEVAPVGEAFVGTGYRVRGVVANRFWREAALVSDDGETAVVPEALGTAPYYRAGRERVAVHPALRLVPPRRTLGDLAPERLLVGHGEPVLDDAGPAVTEALATARRRAPRAYLGALAGLVGR